MKKLYEIAIQNINSWSWTKCSTEAISVLNDAGFSHIKHERRLRDLNMKYRLNEKLPVSYIGTNRPTIVFEIMPELKDKIVRFCNERVAEGTLSVDCLKTEIKNVLIPET